MRVHDLMNPDVEACRPEDDLSAAAMIMWRRDCGIVPVVQPSSQRVVGVITDRDICMATATRHVPPESLRVGDVMADDVATAEDDEPVAGALGKMRERQVHRLPVVDRDGRLRGVLSISDIARTAPNDEVAHRDVVDTWRTIHRPRGEGAGVRRDDERAGDGRAIRDPREPREMRDTRETREEARPRR